MTTHDPLCPHTTLHMDSGEPQRVVINCHCALIARVRAEYTDWVAPGQHDAVVATAEARARADERERLLAQVARTVADEVYLRHRRMGDSEAVRVEAVTNAVEAEVRERIAQEIEAFHAAECGPPESPWPHVCTCVTAAHIARREQP